MATIFDTMSPTEFLKQMHLKDKGGINIKGLSEVGPCFITTPIKKSDTENTGFTFPHAKISFENVVIRSDLTDDPIKAIAPYRTRYIPEAGGNAFLPGSAPPIPACIAQSAIRAAAEGCALAESTGGDSTKIAKLFNKMWGLPDEFDVRTYSPVPNPERKNAWLRYGKDSNYEVHYMKDAQAAIDVTNGSYTSNLGLKKRQVDFDRTRVTMRTIATNVFFNEPGVIDMVKESPKTLYFSFQPESFEEAYVPKWEYDINHDIVPVELGKDVISKLVLHKATANKFQLPAKSVIIKNLPMQLVDELKAEDEFTYKKMKVPKHSLNLNLPELMSSEFSNTSTINFEIPKSIRRKMTLAESFKYALKSWITKFAKADPRIHLLYMHIISDEIKQASRLASDILPDTVLTFAYNVFRDSGRETMELSAFRQLLHTLYGKVAGYPKFNATSVMSVMKGALAMEIPLILWIYRDAYRMSMSNWQRLTVYDFMHEYTLNRLPEDVTNHSMEAAYQHITSLYVSKYSARQMTLKTQIANVKDHMTETYLALTHKLQIIQARIKLVPTLGYLNQPHTSNTALTKMASNYYTKRKRLRKYQSPDELVVPAHPIEANAKILDKAYHTRFTELVMDSLWKSSLAKDDIETLTHDDDTYFSSKMKMKKKWQTHLMQRVVTGNDVPSDFVEMLALTEKPDNWSERITSEYVPNIIETSNPFSVLNDETEFEGFDSEEEVSPTVSAKIDPLIKEAAKLMQEAITSNQKVIASNKGSKEEIQIDKEIAADAADSFFDEVDDDEEDYIDASSLLLFEDAVSFIYGGYYPEAVKAFFMAHYPNYVHGQHIEMQVAKDILELKIEQLNDINTVIKERILSERYKEDDADDADIV